MIVIKIKLKKKKKSNKRIISLQDLFIDKFMESFSGTFIIIRNVYYRRINEKGKIVIRIIKKFFFIVIYHNRKVNDREGKLCFIRKNFSQDL